MERLDLYRATQGGFKRKMQHLDGRLEQSTLLKGFAPRQFEYSNAKPGQLVFGTLEGEVVVANHETNAVVAAGVSATRGRADPILALAWLNNAPGVFVSGSSRGVLKHWTMDGAEISEGGGGGDGAGPWGRGWDSTTINSSARLYTVLQRRIDTREREGKVVVGAAAAGTAGRSSSSSSSSAAATRSEDEEGKEYDGEDEDASLERKSGEAVDPATCFRL